MLRSYLKMRFTAKESKTVLILLLLYSLFAYFNPNILVLPFWGRNPQFYLANYAGFFFWFAALFFILPLFAVYLQPNFHYFQNISIVYRFKNTDAYWMRRVVASFIESALYVSFLYVLLLIRAAFFHQFFHYIQDWSFFLKSYFLQIAAFTLFTVMYIFWSSLFRRLILGFAVTYLLFAYDYIAANVGLPPIYLLCSISFRPEDLSFYWPVLLMTLSYLTIFIIFGFLILKKQDHLQKAVSK